MQNSNTKIEEIIINGLKKILAPTDGSKTLIKFSGIAHDGKAMIDVRLLNRKCRPTAITGIKTIKIPLNVRLVDVFLSLGSYEKHEVTQHQICDFLIENWEIIKMQINFIGFIIEVPTCGYCLTSITVDKLNDRFIMEIIPIEQAVDAIKNDKWVSIIIAPTV